jgi:hypothetical protein
MDLSAPFWFASFYLTRRACSAAAVGRPAACWVALPAAANRSTVSALLRSLSGTVTFRLSAGELFVAANDDVAVQGV